MLCVYFSDKPVITCSDWSPMINTPLDSYPYNVKGNPSPNITWYRDKSSVSTSTRLSRNDSGQYKYVASNVIGNASCVTKITVECECKSCKDSVHVMNCFMITDLLMLILKAVSVLFRCSYIYMSCTL